MAGRSDTGSFGRATLTGEADVHHTRSCGFRRLAGGIAGLLLVSMPAAADSRHTPPRVKEWFEASWGLRAAFGTDDRTGVTSAGFAFMDAELFAPLLPRLKLGDWRLHPIFVGEMIVGVGQESIQRIDRVGDEFLGTHTESHLIAYLSLLMGLGVETNFGSTDEAPSAYLVVASNYERAFFNRTNGNDLSSLKDVGLEPFIGGTYNVAMGRLEVGASLRGGWYRLALRRGFTDYRLEYVHESRSEFAYRGLSFRIAWVGVM